MEKVIWIKPVRTNSAESMFIDQVLIRCELCLHILYDQKSSYVYVSSAGLALKYTFTVGPLVLGLPSSRLVSKHLVIPFSLPFGHFPLEKRGKPLFIRGCSAGIVLVQVEGKQTGEHAKGGI